MEKLSIIMPSYNRANYIEEAIVSILKQKVNFQYVLIIADDASTDHSPEIIKSYAEKYPDKVKGVYSKENRGIFENTQPIFAQMETEYFCVLDADDYYTDPDFLQDAIDFLDKNKDYVCYGANTVKMADGVEIGKYLSVDFDEHTIKSIESYFMDKTMIPHTSGSVWRNVVYNGSMPEFLERRRGSLSQESFRADTGRFMLHLKFGKVYLINKVVSAYRLHKNGVWAGTSKFHHYSLHIRAFLDYMDYYEGKMQEDFIRIVKANVKLASAELFRKSADQVYEELSLDEMENYRYGVQRLKELEEERKGNGLASLNIREQLIYFLQHKKEESLVIWGTGGAAERLIEQYGIKEDEILFFVDNSEKKHNQTINGKKVKSPNEIMKEESKLIIIATSYGNEVERQILENHYSTKNYVINLYRIDQMLCEASNLYRKDQILREVSNVFRT